MWSGIFDHVNHEWLRKFPRHRVNGYAELTRFADDFVAVFRERDDAERIRQEIDQRLTAFGHHFAYRSESFLGAVPQPAERAESRRVRRLRAAARCVAGDDLRERVVPAPGIGCPSHPPEKRKLAAYVANRSFRTPPICRRVCIRATWQAQRRAELRQEVPATAHTTSDWTWAQLRAAAEGRLERAALQQERPR